MDDTARFSSFSHPADVFRFIANANEAGAGVALVTVVGAEGGSVRAPGAFMAVDGEGRTAGYVSNGCVDADLVANARASLEDDAPRRLRYGRGSPFLDIRLPCGGRLDLLVTPRPDVNAVARVLDAMAARAPVLARVSERAGLEALQPDAANASPELFTTLIEPKTRVRIAGRGAETLALARLAAAAEMDVAVQSPDRACLASAAALGAETEYLSRPDDPPPCTDDPWTAFVMMFHDHDWEPALLQDALRGPAFYVGALGSRRTHAARREALSALGAAPADIDRVRGPVGLVPGCRDAASLAVSTLAEIVAAHR